MVSTFLKQSTVGIIFSFIVYVIASILKLTFGVLLQSAALIADGLNSLSDVFATIIMFIGVVVAKKPKDENHHYGHQRYEQVASIIAVVIMMFAGFESLRQGVEKFFSPSVVEMHVDGVIISMFAATIVASSAVVNRYIYKRTKAMANKVIYFDNLGDALVSLLTAVALVLVMFHVYIADSIASIAIGFVILKSSYHLLVEAAHQLSDGFDEEMTHKFTDMVDAVLGVVHVQLLRGRTHGSEHYIEVTIEVDASLTLIEAHDIAERVEKCLLRNTDVIEVIVHYEPCNHMDIKE